MISVEKMKKILADPSLTDEQVEVIRDELRALATIIFEKWQSEKNIKKIINK